MTEPAVAVPEMQVRQPGRVLGAVAEPIAAVAIVIYAAVPGLVPTSLRVFYAVAVPVMVWSVLRQWRAVVVADRTGVSARVQLFRRTRPLPWPEVHHFALRGYWRGLGAWTIDGQWVHLMVYGYYAGDAQRIWRQLEDFRWAQQQALGLI